MSDFLKICAIAFDTGWKYPEENIAKTEQCVKEAKRLFPETQVILFPELSYMGSIVDEDAHRLAESREGRCVTETLRMAQTYDTHIIAGFIESNQGKKPYNTMFVANKSGKPTVFYRKNHLYAGSQECELYEAGAELAPFDLEGWKCGLSCCFDVRFPRLYEAYRRAGTELIFMGFNWFAGRNKPAIMDFMLKARAHENQFFIAATDRSGSDPSGPFTKQGIIVNPYGENVATTTNDIYSYAEIKKEDMRTLRKKLPLEPSFKGSYS